MIPWEELNCFLGKNIQDTLEQFEAYFHGEYSSGEPL